MNRLSIANPTHLLSAIAASLAIATVAAPASAQTVVSGFTTGGDDMNGMQVLVDFLDGTSESTIWGTTGSNAGGAFGTNWGLSLTGSTTFGTPWTFSASNKLVRSLTINAIPGNTMWDTDWPTYPGTPGSANGWTFQVASGQAPDAYSYSVPIDISVGDLWGTLSMQWLSGFTGTMRFYGDTDNGTASNPVQAAKPIPEPGTVLALATVGALTAASRRRRQPIG
ncbi:PEP-CTERM sorting domain-containing protein [[Phormidium] sp. ETS-05]|uniref:PEP-CTERM sorting domain-containing protein n=1 Tax=[Phormidium] sp. ETS-05 TaxID=222819 RepID=UPI0018EED72E|nr:PEP-CTERM sorting domain-containing protein [[Phormidium] sp. ETS-05]